jgi:WD40 repeat protein
LRRKENGVTTKFAYVACECTVDPKTNWVGLSADRVHVHDLASGKTRQLPADPKAAVPGYTTWSLNWDHHGMRWCGGVVFSPDGKRLFSAHSWDFNGCCILVWDAATGAIEGVVEVPAWLANIPQALALSPDGGTLASCHHGEEIRLWDVSEPALQRLRRTMQERVKAVDEAVHNGKEPPRWEPAVLPRAGLRGHSAIITAITFHPDGKILASASTDGTIKLWDVVTGEVRLTLEGQVPNLDWTYITDTRVAELAFAPDGGTLIYGTDNGTLKRWRGAAVPVRKGP